MRHGLVLFTLPLLLAACSGNSATDGGADLAPIVQPLADYSKPGPFPVGHMHTTIADRSGNRLLPVEIWYPADESARAAATTGHPIAEFEVDATRSAQVATWAANSPDGCTRKSTGSAKDAMPAASPAKFPLVMFSHCSTCIRWSSFSVVERLASHGIAVAAPDHLDNNLFEQTAVISEPFLATRAGDIQGVLDALLDEKSAAVPEKLRGRFDAAKVGMMGHSYGSATAGRVVETDSRVLAGFFIAAPIDSPLLGDKTISQLKKPSFFLLAVEDNSIGELGNTWLRDNFAAAPPPTWLGEVEGAGHFSFSDIAGLNGEYKAGCGMGKRQTDGTQFSYLDNTVGRGVGQAYATGFFARYLLGDVGAAGWIGVAHPEGKVTVTARN